MAEYYSKEALMEASRSTWYDMYDLEDFLTEVPIADVVEVKHGYWRSVEGDVIFACSNCDAEISTSWDYENDDMFTYCPCCGFRMDGTPQKEG